ncbi:Hypothetical predicted protein [Podarcis lilfordi]|uniref:Coiled-coil domain containing 87 n=1 Tax=Podarcis lilfordi TaxID=74358 RepID=A0AA35LKX9_9SAUR|nr:Hypothetical predicted protein [Podarcis lilfordi]
MNSFVALPRREVYALDNTEKASQQLHDHYQRILAPLSLFPATVSRLRSSIDKGSSAISSLQKPVPVPISLANLMQLLKGRMEVGTQWQQIPSPHQRAFQQVILTEVKHIFKDVQRSLYDPAFSPQENRELYQHLVTYIGLVCQHLFRRYLSVMERHRALSVFTDCANLTRFSAQLSLDCSRLLNVAAVRHRLIMDTKTLQLRQTETSRKRVSMAGWRSTQMDACNLHFSIDYFIRLMKPHIPTMRQKIAKDIKELEDLPLLDMNKIKQLNLPRPNSSSHFRQMQSDVMTMPCSCTSTLGDRPKLQRVKHAISSSLKRSQSLPNMRVGQLLADELGIRLSVRPISPDLPCHYGETTEDDGLKGMAGLAEDLRRLAQRTVLKSSQQKGEQDEDLELPPLIKALTRRKTNEVRLEQLQRILCSLQREESFEMSRKNTMIAAPATHPQAATVNFKVNERMVVKAADMQVSERTYVEAVSMEICPVIYNHLLGEIDNATVKSLDANLSTGEEVREMYKELMNTIPKDHLKFDLGPMIESPATNIELAGCFASSTLTRGKSEQVINKELSNILPPGPFVPEEVSESPNVPFKKNTGKKTSWLKWWKATFNTDDYLKYIGTKESDYLPVIFHLYSVKEDEEQQPVLDEVQVKKQVKVKRDVIKKAAELQTKKEEFEHGKWNSQCAMLRGLENVFCSDHTSEDLKVFQRRLERLWTVLHFSEQERLDMAIKYSANPYYWLLPDMLQAWETAARSIQDRELLLADLEQFEETASNPNRLFNLAPRSFIARMKESRTRNRLRSELAQYDSELYIILNNIKESYNDTVTYKGRPYLQKMAWDTVEMLYWLQQERRANTLRRVVQKRGLIRRLPPIP